MPIMLQSNHALFFDGVSDSVIIPQGNFSKLGQDYDKETAITRRSSEEIVSHSSGRGIIADALGSGLAIEAWVIPDCGGVILMKDGQFRLSMGTVDTPGPIEFEANLTSSSIGDFKVLLRSAQPETNGYDGHVYPVTTFGGLDDSYNRFDSGKDKATSLSKNQRPLYHIVACINQSNAEIYVNGDLVANQNIPVGSALKSKNSHVYIGGKGGEFRGVIEGIHVSSSFSNEMTTRNPSMVSEKTISLFRFEEPISPLDTVYTISSIDSTYSDSGGGTPFTENDLTAITIPTADAQSLANALTGKTITDTYVDFTISPYSTGDYSVIDRYSTPGTTTNHLVPHVPYNLLINPGSINQNSKKPNGKPPERVRLHRINISSGELLVSSIHLDFKNTTNTNGLRPILHSTHTSANGANSFVVISADCLIENGTGRPYQPPHLATQLIDRAGQMLIDEGEYEQHAMVYSSRMSTTAVDTDNPFAVAWPTDLDESFQIGHSGRHILNHIEGHSYLRMMPRANEENLDQQAGNSDILTLMYDAATKGIDKMFPINSQVDYYKDTAAFEIKTVVNSSAPHEVVSNGLAGANRTLIAIGGSKTGARNFNPLPFVLKGPVPSDLDNIDSNVRKFHLHPSRNSRVALLHVPTLASRGLAPYVEVHYNAIDFTGASMNKTAPMLMVEKTVPASNYEVASGVYVYDDIATDVAAGTATLYSPGGYIDVGKSKEGNLGSINFSHSLVGDNSEGFEADVELDERLTPANFTATTTNGNTTPQSLTASHTTKAQHDSVFHRILIERVQNADALEITSEFNRMTPHTVHGSPSAGQFDIGVTSSASAIHEMFDIIDNVEITTLVGVTHRFFIQPSDRTRTNQLQYIYSTGDRPDSSNIAVVMFLMGRSKLRGVEQIEGDEGRFTVVNCVGLSDVAATRSINELGSGSPDSHVVKEIDPNAPVVSVTLGGVGQGAYDTKPSFDRSTLAHLPYSSRRGFSCLATKVRVDLSSSNETQFIEVSPLNNESPDLASWGTYPFPKVGRIYLKNGANAEYQSKNGSCFLFTDSTIATRRFLLPNGNAVATFQDWVVGSGLRKDAGTLTGTQSQDFPLGEIIMGDGHFFVENLQSDGTTVNDRMFQSMDNISHDYQLGTQFASTRALVEIPLFRGQFFVDRFRNSYPSPDNSLKLHIDPTMTAHTWNPSPVGRRYQDMPPSDRSAYGAFAKSILSNQRNNQSNITNFEILTSTYRIYVSNPKMYPAGDTSSNKYFNVDDVLLYRRVFLPSGEWAIYSNNPAADGYIEIVKEESYVSEAFVGEVVIGLPLLMGNAYDSQVLVPLKGDSLNAAADFENRGEHYYDAASVKTQGGNIDYGLRQYVSAVEFKAGPLSNPHAAKIQSKRAAGTILSVEPIMNGSVYTGFAHLIMSQEDVDKFPTIERQPNAINADYEWEMGQAHYSLEIGANTFVYFGEGNKNKSTLVTSGTTPTDSLDTLSSIIVMTKENNSIPSYLDNDTLKGEVATLTKYGYDVFFSSDKYNTLLDNTVNMSHTGRPLHYSAPWEVTGLGGSDDELGLAIGKSEILQSNTFHLNVQHEDWLYAEHHKDGEVVKVTLLGQVDYIDESIIVHNPVTLPQAAGIVHLKSAVPTANKTSLNAMIGAAALSATEFVYLRTGCHSMMVNDEEACLNRTWLFPYAQGGLRRGDTIWMNMTYNNPHAVQGMFAKSRGVLNEALVWKGFNGGLGLMAAEPRDSIPLENFLIGDSCIDTARNFVQHVNKTIELNYTNLGIGNPPTVAYLDPYLATEGHARVLLYDVAHDREFIAFQDIHMQVQTSQKAAEIGFERLSTSQNVADGTDEVDLSFYSIKYNGGGQNPFITQVDVANGYPSQNKYIRAYQHSNFMESAYAHNIANSMASEMLDPVKGIVTRVAALRGQTAFNKQNGTGYPSGTTTNVATTAINTTGTGLTVDITTTGGQITTIAVNNPGSGYLTSRSGGSGFESKVRISGGDNNAVFKVFTTNTSLINTLTTMTQSMIYGKAHGHFVHTGFHTGGPLARERTLGDSITSRTNNATVTIYHANKEHKKTRKLFSSNDILVKALMQHRIKKGKTLTLKAGGSTYNNGTFFNVRTTSDGKGKGMTVDVTISSNAVATATVRRHGNSLYKDGDTIFIEDRRVNDLPSAAPPVVAGDGKGSFTLNLNNTNDETSTLFDTPDGTRVIPAFLALKGIRSEALDLSNMNETRLQHLPQWTQMDFTRRMTIDLGEVAVKDGITNVEAAATEVVRMINQAAAKKGRTHSDNNNKQYPVKVAGEADFATTGSTHDPAVWWDEDKAFESHDKGTHMGYIRAHLGRVVKNIDGSEEGFSIIIHSTVPGATGRNFCVWLDNSKGQIPYRPEFMIGHGGRFRTFWCMPDEISGENMHPAPMPLNKHGRPFAPITSLRQYTQPDESMQAVASKGEFSNNHDETTTPKLRAVSAYSGSGQNHNTLNTESVEIEGFNTSFTEGLRVGTNAVARVNFGGLVAAGIPGFAPDAGKWGFGRKGDNRFANDYGLLTTVSNTDPASTYTGHVPTPDTFPENIGDTNLYGLRLQDHRGVSHGLRYIYKNMDDEFALDNTILPKTLDNEVAIYFNHKDCSQGGFTIGRHMHGISDPTGRFPAIPDNANLANWRGNYWRGTPAPNASYNTNVVYSAANQTITVTLYAPYDACDHHDILGYMGFPAENGVIHLSDPFNHMGIATITAGGSGYTANQTGADAIGVGGSGDGMTLSINTNSSNAVTSVTITSLGEGGYINGDTISVSGIGGTNAQFTLGESINGNWGNMFSYTHRTRNDKTGTHVFHGVVGDTYVSRHKHHSSSTISAPVFEAGDYVVGETTESTSALITPVANWTTLITDELMAAVTAFAINLDNPNKQEGHFFDCTEMYAADGRTFAEWGITEESIKIKAYNTKNDIEPISNFFTASLSQDIGIRASHIEYGEVESLKLDDEGVSIGGTGDRPVTNDLIDNGRSVNCGYIPSTVLQITTSGRGHNANTPTPNIVDSQNNPIDTNTWRKNLIGENFIESSGDLILPNIDNPTLKMSAIGHSGGALLLHSDNAMWHFAKPSGEESNVNHVFNGSSNDLTRVNSFGTQTPISYGKHTAITESQGTSLAAAESTFKAISDENLRSEDWPSSNPSGTIVIQKYNDTRRAFLFAGKRSLGSVHSIPIIRFTGARDSPDNYVPLFFGGGFSGATIDINDGTQNDYSEHNTHPYANGPTGSSGIQNANEILSSFSTIDCNAIMAFFPATALLKQHRGSINPPVYNKDSILSQDLKRGSHTPSNIHPNAAPYTAGVHMQVPSPMVLRFAHPTARYQDHRDGTENKTTFIIFGPGQAFPLTQESASPNNNFEPHPGHAISTGNGWSRVPNMSSGAGGRAFLPNHIHNSNGDYMPERAATQLNKRRFHYRQVLNWESPLGIADNVFLRERPESGRNYGNSFTAAAFKQYNSFGNFTDNVALAYSVAQPSRHAMFYGHGMVKNADLCWHMDNGNHPGGSWMDNQITMNPPREADDARIPAQTTTTQINKTAFRVAGTLATKMLYSNGNSSSPAFAAETLDADDVDHDYIVVDATRCQNSEELACVLGAAINTFPGKGALKAIGGTFMPSMGNSTKQDRYGWIEAESTVIPAGVYGGGAGGVTPHSSVSGLGYSNNVISNEPMTRQILTTSTFTGNITSGDPVIAVTGTFPPNMQAGQTVTGLGIQANTVVVSFTSNTITVSPNPNATNSGVTITHTHNTLGNTASLASNLKAGDCFIDLRIVGYSITDAQSVVNRIPASGWLRTEANTDYGGVVSSSVKTAAWACYHSRATYRDGSDLFCRFFLSNNKITGLKAFEDGEAWRIYANTTTPFNSQNGSNVGGVSLPHPAPTNGTKVWIWSKSSTLGVDNSTNFQRYLEKGIGAVHFSGIVDAIDRTKPVGVVGWHGERYSYLNTLPVDGGYSAGLGAWHSMLGFSPYGAASSCATILGHLPHTTPLPNSPESMPPTDVPGRSLDNFPSDGDTESDQVSFSVDDPVAFGTYVVGWADGAQFNNPPVMRTMPELQKELVHPQGTYARALLVVAHEGELSLVARKDRDSYTTTGDYLLAGGTTQWDERFHNADRFIAPANAGPNVEALIVDGTAPPTIADYTATSALDDAPFNAQFYLHGSISADTSLLNAQPCFAETGDLFFDIDKNVGIINHEEDIAERNLATDFITANTNPSAILVHNVGTNQSPVFWAGDVNAYDVLKRSPHKNFSTEHIVWKRMDGGTVTMPASNARGLGAVPWITRVKNAVVGGAAGTAHQMGEKLYGNIRFSFETTNSAMMPVLQAQEIAHPTLAKEHPIALGGILEIPNEEIQFEDITVVDDTGQVHTLEGGSPLGIVIRAYKPTSTRLASGLQPVPANSGIAPNFEIQLPDPESIPGNILVRSGFDPIQAYQTETVGDGGMIHPDLGASHIGHLFDNVVKSPRKGPTMNEVGWEHISQGENFPESTRDGWVEATRNNSLRSSYEQQDRALYFHITKMGHSHTEKFPVTYTHAAGVVNQDLTVNSFASPVLTASATITPSIFDAGFGTKEVADNRRFIRITNPAGESVVASYASIGTGGEANQFKGVVGDIDFDQFLVDNPPATTTLTITPSYYIPAGSTRIFAARRLRDHAEVSGNSPDMAHTLYFDGDSQTTIHSRYSKPQLTPMPIPRMGHHFVNATMPMMPGHWAHPSYAGLYDRANSDRLAALGDEDYTSLAENLVEVDGTTNNQTSIPTAVKERIFPLNPALRVGSLTANPSGPSDIHGGAFTLMFETKIKYDGYGILASKGTAGDMNKAGGHSIVLEAGGNYTQTNHFPDPAEVGAYQIVIQPNLRSQQITGFHRNNADSTGLPTAGTELSSLTSQQVALVIGIRYDEGRHATLTNSANIGGLTLILSEATLADVRGCEIFLNEVILDHDPDHGSQFTNIPPMLLYNPLGVQGSESPHFTRRGHPYHPTTSEVSFKDATPGFTTNIPWWSIMHQGTPSDASAVGFRHLALYRIDNYYQFCRASYGAIGAQLTLAGYPSIYPDIYSKIMENVSLTPTCIVVGNHSSSTTIQVDDCSLFPEIPYYGQKLQYIDPDTGETVSFAYTKRRGTTHSSSSMNEPDIFHLPTGVTLTSGTKLTLSKPYSTKSVNDIFNIDSESVMTKNLGQLLNGTRDTNSLFLTDAYLCAWSPNLGRPHTFYSDASRTWITNGVNHTADRAVNNAAYNSMPQHFETIHYQDVNYTASHGPFALKMKTPKPPQPLAGTVHAITTTTVTVITMTTTVSGVSSNDVLFAKGRVIGRVNTVSGANITLHTKIFQSSNLVTGDTVYVGADGSIDTAVNINSMTGISSQGGATAMLTNFWPCGSRGGALVSRLDGYAMSAAAWHLPQNYAHGAGLHWRDDDDSGSYAVANGVSTISATGIRTYPFGYRFGLRQAWNRPQWGHYGMRAFQEQATHSGASNFAVGYKAGPLVEYEAITSNGWLYAGGDTTQSNTNLPTTYVGIIERSTTAAGMLNADKYEWQVRYSEGRRMTRGFGCAIRTIRNASTVLRDWWGDSAGKGMSQYRQAAAYYLIDWWGNTRGEDVRRFPVRSFGINPSWDAGDAYEYDRANGRTPFERVWNNGKPIFDLKGIVDFTNGNVLSSPTVTIPRFGGRKNTGNNNTDTTLVDVFAPTNAMRVGDMGNGRGVRFPTQFNEDRLVELSAVYENSGIVLSGNTAEPTFGEGLIRPRNDVLQASEIVRGISSRLEVDEDGLLKPEATVSDKVESISGTSVHKDAISRSSPRIGIDGDTIESFTGSNSNMIAINSEAHSLHTNRGVGQRVVLHGGMQSGSQTLGDYDLTSLSFAAQPHGGVMRFSHTSNFKPMGGTYILEARSFASPFDDTGWGRSGMSGTKTSNPYQTTSSIANPTNKSDDAVQFMLRPIRLLDNQHIAVFRPALALHSGSKQNGSTAFTATAGGKYGLFTYSTPNGRASSGSYMRATNPDTSAPYQPVYLVESSSDTVPVSKGPKLPGTEVTGFDKTTLKSSVTRLIISENTLQHFKSDAPRRTGQGKDYTVKSRFSQSLHSKGHKEDVSFNTSDHSGDA
jgi:hypothetical protein